jgi:hypothetical protein
MKQEPDLTPFRFAWRGAAGGFIGPLAFVLFCMYCNPIFYLAPLSLMVVVVGGGGGALSGFIIGLFYTDGMRVGLAVRLIVALGIATFVALPFVTVLQMAVQDMIFFVLITGLPPAMVTTSKRLVNPERRYRSNENRQADCGKAGGRRVGHHVQPKSRMPVQTGNHKLVAG